MDKGTNVPARATPPDRLEVARQAQSAAVQAFEAAQRGYVACVNALPVPALMDGAKVRVTDLDDYVTLVHAASESAGTDEQFQRLMAEVLNYREARQRCAALYDLARLAEAVVNAVAELARVSGEASA